MISYAIVREKIKDCIDGGITSFAIFPYGENGMLVAQILGECFGIEDAIRVDNELCRYNKKICDLTELERIVKETDCHVLLTSYAGSIRESLSEHVATDRVVELFGSPEKGKKYKHTKIGKYCYGPLVRDDVRIERIGSFCCFAEGVDVVWNHPLDMVTQHDFIYESYCCKEIDNQKYTYEELNKKYVIGNDVWLGKNVLLTNGVKLGNGVRAAAGAVITKDVPDYAVVGGVPAKIIKYRFSDDQIEKLNQIAWWDWPIEKIKACYDDFMDIDVFLDKHYKSHNAQEE